MVYQALDFGLPESEEPSLSADLEQLIDKMTGSAVTSSDTSHVPRGSDDDADEGIEEEEVVACSTSGVAGDGNQFSLDDVIQSCCEHLPQKTTSAESHYKAVCRALVTESIELTTFLESISSNKAVSQPPPPKLPPPHTFFPEITPG